MLESSCDRLCVCGFTALSRRAASDSTFTFRRNVWAGVFGNSCVFFVALPLAWRLDLVASPRRTLRAILGACDRCSAWRLRIRDSFLPSSLSSRLSQYQTHQTQQCSIAPSQSALASLDLTSVVLNQLLKLDLHRSPKSVHSRSSVCFHFTGQEAHDEGPCRPRQSETSQ